MPTTPFPWVAALLAIGCGGVAERTVPPPEGTDAASGADAAPEAQSGSDAPTVDQSIPADAAPPNPCSPADESFYWSYKTCTSDTECVAAVHTVDCCGTQRIVGVAKASLSAFSACEAAWDHGLPACGCASQPTTAEDGKHASDPSAVTLVCTDWTMESGICKTRAN